ncbi:MAG: FAD-dependent oxidoreductase [Mycoplasmataceae bacterium]|jgi:thioredoxin reductase (NADPH)|nr:FAD-dependent oxidoreductase [Mycoplasmataceae bacterium]
MGLETLVASDSNTYDILIIGAGPAGLTAAIYGCKANLKTGFIENNVPGGKVVNVPVITNYPGYQSISGADLALNMYIQATNLGAKYIYGKVVGIVKKNDYIVAFLDNGVNFFTKACIIATGTINNKLSIKGEDQFINKGISYCAVCDGSLAKNKDVAVIGNDTTTIENAKYMSNIAKTVYLLTNNSVDINNLPKNVKIIANATCKEFKGTNSLEQLVIQTDKEEVLDVSFVFVFNGITPSNDFLKDLEITNDKGIINVDDNQQTKIPGLYAIGDISRNKYRQISTAIGDAATATLSAIKHVKEKYKK